MHVQLSALHKTFHRGRTRHEAVRDVGFQARPGEILGVLGPNGAGKTTVIRMLLDILRPDQGEIRIDGDPGGSRHPSFKARTGYLPEERGLYQRRKIDDVLAYLGALKGLDRQASLERAGALLDQLGLEGWRGQRVDAMSKGMGQKIQIVGTLLHAPDLVVLDEPFSGLDPVNVRLIRELVAQLRAEGRTVMLSTHLMSEVEALCDRIVMLNRGQVVLEGPVDDVRRAHTHHDVTVDDGVVCDDLESVERVTLEGSEQHLTLAPGRGIDALMAELGAKGRTVTLLREATASLEEIFVQRVTEAA